MNPTNLTYFLLIYIPLYLATHIGLFLLFKKANAKMAWLAFFPVVCYWPWIQITGRPKYWMLWSLVPAADVIIWFSLVIDMMESFGRFKFVEQVVAVLFPFYYYPKLAMAADVKYLGQSRQPEFRKKYIPAKRGAQREWADAIFFAFIVAYLIRTFQLEPYKIPTSSMEDSMKVGDFLFVSKMNYGPRFPITPIAFPLVHQDFLGAKAYSELIELPYMRLPGFQNIKRNDPIVFNVPIDGIDPTERPVDKMQNYVKRCVGIPGDKLEIKKGVLYINDKPGFQPAKMQHLYFIRFNANSTPPTRETLTNTYDIYDYAFVDPSNLILKIWINDEDLVKIKSDFDVAAVTRIILPNKSNLFMPEEFRDPTNPNKSLGPKFFNGIIALNDSTKLSYADMNKLGIIYSQPLTFDQDTLQVLMNDELIDVAKAKQVCSKIRDIKHKYDPTMRDYVFPSSMADLKWNKDNYGPIYLPKRGESIKIDKNNFYIYEQAIKVYEKNETFELRGSTPYLNGVAITNYTFKFDYYWMMGDNRDNSSDSRYFGYVPENYIVGKPLFVFFSIQYKQADEPKPGTDGNEFVKIRWNRLFRGIQ